MKKNLLRGQRSEDGRQKTEVRGQRSEVRGRKAEDRTQRSEVRGQRSEVRGQGPEGTPVRIRHVSGSSARIPERVSSIQNPVSSIQNPEPVCSLRNEHGFWELLFDGQSAVLKQDQALFYVAWLLANASLEPIAAHDLAVEVYEMFCEHDDFGRAVSGMRVIPDCWDGDGVEFARLLIKRQKVLEAILDRPDELEPVKAEAPSELAAVYELETTCALEIAGLAKQMAEIIWEGLLHLHATLASAVDAQGQPHPVIRAFARHLLRYLLMPSVAISGTAVIDWFVYQRPE